MEMVMEGMVVMAVWRVKGHLSKEHADILHLLSLMVMMIVWEIG